MNLDLLIVIVGCIFAVLVRVFIKTLNMKPGQKSKARGIAAPLLYMLGALLIGIIIALIKLRTS